MKQQSNEFSDRKNKAPWHTAVVDSGSLTAEELARLSGLAVVLAKERLLAAETVGRLCRDDSIEGLRFYPNLFLSS